MWKMIRSWFEIKEAVFDVSVRNEATQDIECYKARARFSGMFDLEEAECYVRRQASKAGFFVINMTFEGIE